MGFEEIPHTADSSIRVWAPDLKTLFAEAARGMNLVSGALIDTSRRIGRALKIEGPDPESLLVAFLNELLYLQESQGLGLDAFDLLITVPQLAGSAQGGPLLELRRPLKAATFHNLHLRSTDRGLETEIVFDA